jgi:hypothetical protein
MTPSKMNKPTPPAWPVDELANCTLLMVQAKRREQFARDCADTAIAQLEKARADVLLRQSEFNIALEKETRK